MTRRSLLFAVLLTIAALAKGPRAFVEAMTDVAEWLRDQTDCIDLGWDAA